MLVTIGAGCQLSNLLFVILLGCLLAWLVVSMSVTKNVYQMPSNFYRGFPMGWVPPGSGFGWFAAPRSRSAAAFMRARRLFQNVISNTEIFYWLRLGVLDHPPEWHRFAAPRSRLAAAFTCARPFFKNVISNTEIFYWLRHGVLDHPPV